MTGFRLPSLAGTYLAVNIGLLVGTLCASSLLFTLISELSKGVFRKPKNLFLPSVLAKRAVRFSILYCVSQLRN